MQRLIVTSATYRQSSKVDAGAAREGSREPAARARPARAAAGRDDSRHRARGERPAQRSRSADRACCRISRRGCGRRWRSATASRRRRTSRATARISTAAACTRSGSARCRRHRSRRSTRPTARSAPARRALTNTPLQALVLLNDPTYVEASRALAQRALLEGGTDDESAHRVRVPPGDRAQADAARRSSVLRTLLDSGSTSFREDPPGRAQAAGGRRVAARHAARPVGARGVDDGDERHFQSGRDDRRIAS